MRFQVLRSPWLLSLMLNVSVNAVPANNSNPSPAPLRVFLGSRDTAPYDELSSAEVLCTFSSAVLGRLLQVSRTYSLKPGLIEKWVWNAPEKSYTLHLRKNIELHSGKKADAFDLEFGILRGFFTERRSFFQMFLKDIDGLDEIEKGAKFKSGVVKGVKVIDPLTLKIVLKNENPAFLFSLTHPYFSLVDRAALEDDYVTWKKYPVGAGPYKVEAPGFKDGVLKLSLAKPLEHTKAPRSVELYAKDILPEYDVALYLPVNVTPYEKISSPRANSILTVFFTNQNPLGKDENFRKAILSATNRKELEKIIPDSTAAYELLPSQHWGRANIQETFDLKAAQNYLSKLPKELLAKTWRVPVFSAKDFSPTKAKTLEVLQAQWAKLGLKVAFYPSQEKFLSVSTATESPMKISGRVTDYMDPTIMFASLRKGSPYIYERSAQPDAKFEEMFDASVKETVPTKKHKLVQRLSQYINDQAWVVPLLEIRDPIYINRKTVADGVTLDTTDYLIVEDIILKASKAE